MYKLSDAEFACTLLLVLLILLLYCYTKKKESFGMDNRPMEHENSLLHMNVWDNVDYIVPTMVINDEPIKPIFATDPLYKGTRYDPNN
jgi:hypothetical protein